MSLDQHLSTPAMHGKEIGQANGNAVEDLGKVEPTSTISQDTSPRTPLHVNLHSDGHMVQEPMVASPVSIHPNDPIASKLPSSPLGMKKSFTGPPTTTANGRQSDTLYQRSATTTLIPQLHKKQQLAAQADYDSSINGYPNMLQKTESTGGIANPSRFSGDRLERRSTVGPDLGGLAPDEQLILEQEIAARRAARRASRRRQETEDEDRVMIGTRVAEGHRNYQLMYDMLTGIRIAVGRVSAKMKRDLTNEDFKAAHKLVFDITGNELTPGVKYDFKFKDYAPWVFRNLRESFKIDPADYMISLTDKYILSELGSPGKSGSFFYYSRDYRFIIKTIHYTEHKFMRKVLRQYYDHVVANPNTLLCRFYGLHRIKLPHGSKIHFVVMGNVLPANRDVHFTFDLKGSTFGRVTPDEEVQKNPNAVMKDLNWEQRNCKLEFGPEKSSILMQQLESDVKLLIKLNIMDYSLLIGIHDLKRGNRDNIRDNHLQLFQPYTKRVERQLSLRNKRESKAQIVRKAIATADPTKLDVSKLSGALSTERKYCVFYADDGGFQATSEDDEPSDLLYFVGVIDILTPYNYVKKVEHFWKGMTLDKKAISAVPPAEYGARFLRFMHHSLKHPEYVVSPSSSQEKKNN